MTTMSTMKLWEGRNMNLGFIGTGGITTILVNGFLVNNKGLEIVVSPRNAEYARRLLEKYPANVRIATNNQEVVDLSEYVFLCVKPERAEEAIKPLVFGKRHKVFNLIAGLTLETLRNWTGDVDLLVHIIPLSFAAFGYGPVVLYPYELEARNLIEKIGEVFVAESFEIVRIFQSLTAVQASFYTLLNNIVDWAMVKSLPADLATSYISSLFLAFAKALQGVDKEGLYNLSNEMTPKGLNWMVKSNLLNLKAINAWTDSLSLALDRLRPDKN